MSQDHNQNPILPILAEDEQFMSPDAFSSANSANDWDALVTRGGCSNNANDPSSGMSRWERDSLYVKFDPLLNSKTTDGGGGAADDRLSSIFKVPKLPGGVAPPPPPPLFGGGGGFGGENANVITPLLSDSGSSYKSAESSSPTTSTSQQLVDNSLLPLSPPANSNGLMKLMTPPNHHHSPLSDSDPLAKGDAESSFLFNNTDFELAAEFVKENLNETVVLGNPTSSVEQDHINGNINRAESGPESPLPSAPPISQEMIDSVINGGDESTPSCRQNNLLFSPFSIPSAREDDNNDDTNDTELNEVFKRAVAIGSPLSARLHDADDAVRDLEDPDPIDEEEFKRRADQSISDDSFLEAFSRGLVLKTPAKPVGLVKPQGKSLEGVEEENSSNDLNGTFNMTSSNPAESLNVTQILGQPDQVDDGADCDAETAVNGRELQQQNAIPPSPHPPPPVEDNDDDDDEQVEGLDRTATPLIDTSFNDEEDDISTAPNSVEPASVNLDLDLEVELELEGCQDSTNTKADTEQLLLSSPKMNESEEDFHNCPRLSDSFVTASNGGSPDPDLSSSSTNKGRHSSGGSYKSGRDSLSRSNLTPTPPPPSPPPTPPSTAAQEQLQRIQKLKETIAQMDAEYEQQCKESDAELAKKEAKLKAISDQCESELTDLENLEASQARAKQERDQALDDLKTMEANFAEMLGMYEYIKSLQTRVEQNCEILKRREIILVQTMERKEDRDNAACQVVEDCLEVMKLDFETRVKDREAENIKLKARLRMSEMNIEKMEAKMGQLDRESDKLRGLCDDLLNSGGVN